MSRISNGCRNGQALKWKRLLDDASIIYKVFPNSLLAHLTGERFLQLILKRFQTMGLNYLVLFPQGGDT